MGESYSPISEYFYGEEYVGLRAADADFIAHARTDVPALHAGRRGSSDQYAKG